MKKNYIILLLAILFSGITIAQEAQKNFINYQGVARNGADQLMANESMTIGIALKMGSATGASGYAENHSVTTDANGVFSLKIGNGDAVSGEYNTIPWGGEATFVTVLINGSEIGTTEMMAVPYALSSGDGSQTATEVPYDNGISGLAATNAQEAIDELVGSGAVDADADPANEFQMLSFDAVTNELSLTDGNSITIPTGGTDGDADATNEIQHLSLSGTNLEISDGTGVDLAALIPPGGTDDQNASEVPFDNSTSTLIATDTQAALEELAAGGLVDTDDQNLSLTGTLLQISDGTGVDLAPIIPPGGTDDQNAGEVPYDNTVSALAATDTQAAIDELASGAIGGSSLWDLNGSDINYGTGNVGINTVTPTARLDIKHNSTLAIPQLRLEETEVDYARLEFKNDATGFWHIAGRGGDTGDVSRLNFYHHNGTIGRDFMTIAGSGDVGIGTASPQAPFDIAGQNNWDLNATEGDFRLGNDTYRLKMGTALGGAGAGNARIRAHGGSNKLLLGSGNLDVLSIVDTNVGIGTIDPTIELDVVGSIRSSDLSGAGQRNVMADTDGNLIIEAGGGGGSLWTQDGSNINYTSGRVGIGTGSESSNAVLEVAGGANSEGILNVKDTELVGRNLAISGFGLQGRFDGANSYLGLNRNGGDVFIGNGETTVGIGLTGFSVPESTLDVNGDIRSRNLIGGGNVAADADGNLVIGAGGGGSSLWTQDGSNINYTSGDVGIGTPDPTAKAHVLHNSNLASPQLRLEESSNDYSRLEFKNESNGYWHIAGRGGDTGDVSRLNFYHHNGTIGRDYMTIAGSGNVGVGTTAPSAKLDVAGDIKTSGEIHGPTTGSANMVPIAYGRISSSGTIVTGSNNFTVTRSTTGRYFIVIPGMTDDETRETVIVATRINFLSPPGFIGGGSGFTGGNPALIVLSHDVAGAAENIDFSFVAYKR